MEKELYTINKEAKRLKDLNKLYKKISYLYDLKEKTLLKLLKQKKAKIVGVHTFDFRIKGNVIPKKIALIEYNGFYFHSKNAADLISAYFRKDVPSNLSLFLSSIIGQILYLIFSDIYISIISILISFPIIRILTQYTISTLSKVNNKSEGTANIFFSDNEYISSEYKLKNKISLDICIKKLENFVFEKE